MKHLGSKNIITDRLELRKQTMDEQKYLWELLMKEEVNKYFLTTPPKFGEKLKDWSIQEKFYKEKVLNADSLDNFEWSIFLKNSDICIGRISCQEGEGDDENIRDIGWMIDPNYQHQGFGYEAAKAVLDFMFNECDIDMIKTCAAIINPASWKLMEKLGFVRTDEIVKMQYTYVEGLIDCYTYLLNKELFYSKNNLHK